MEPASRAGSCVPYRFAAARFLGVSVPNIPREVFGGSGGDRLTGLTLGPTAAVLGSLNCPVAQLYPEMSTEGTLDLALATSDAPSSTPPSRDPCQIRLVYGPCLCPDFWPR